MFGGEPGIRTPNACLAKAAGSLLRTVPHIRKASVLPLDEPFFNRRARESQPAFLALLVRILGIEPSLPTSKEGRCPSLVDPVIGTLGRIRTRNSGLEHQLRSIRQG